MNEREPHLGLFSFYEGDSFLHRRNPAAKVAATAVLMLALTLIYDPWLSASFLALALGAGWLGGRISPLKLLRSLWAFAPLVASLIFVNTFFHRGGGAPIFSLWLLTATREGLRIGLSVGLRVFCLVTYSALFVATTDPTELILSLIQQWRLDYRFGYGALVAYRLLPLFEAEYAIIRAAHRLRGVDEGRGIGSAWRRLRRYALPILVSAVRKSDRVAVAMDSKAFGALPQRTYHRQMRVEWADWLLLLVATVAAATGLFLAWRWGRIWQ
jgi:energy-coupling factor transport system permease protein